MHTGSVSERTRGPRRARRPWRYGGIVASWVLGIYLGGCAAATIWHQGIGTRNWAALANVALGWLAFGFVAACVVTATQRDLLGIARRAPRARAAAHPSSSGQGSIGPVGGSS